MLHKHEWKRDNSRTHGRPPRFFVICKTCTEKAQAVISYGHLVVFKTSQQKKDKADVKKVRTIRLSDKEMKDVENGKKILTVVESRITLAV